LLYVLICPSMKEARCVCVSICNVRTGTALPNNAASIELPRCLVQMANTWEHGEQSWVSDLPSAKVPMRRNMNTSLQGSNYFVVPRWAGLLPAGVFQIQWPLSERACSLFRQQTPPRKVQAGLGCTKHWGLFDIKKCTRNL
jgi:hypothetical protein